MNPTDNLVAFLGLYSTTVETTESIDKNSKELLKIEEKEKKQTKKDRKERWQKIKDARAKARKEKLKKFNPLNLVKKFWGNKKDNEKKGMSLMQKILLGLGIAGGAAGFVSWATGDSESAKKFRESLKKWTEWLKGEIQKAIDAGLKLLEKEMQKYIDKLKEDLDKTFVDPIEDAINDGIRNPLQDLVGGGNYTTRKDGKGVKFNYTDVVNLRNKQADFLAQSGVSGPGAAEQLNKYAALMEQMKKAKTANDQLYTQKQELERLRKLRKQYETTAKHRIPKMDENIARQEQRLAEYEAKDKKQDALVTALWRKLNISESDLQAIQRRQTGGPIVVPGQGDGDKVPMMLPAGSFVLNRNASSFLGFQKGGEIKKATSVLHKDEALSSLTAGVNDYIKPGGNSVRSKTPWSEVKPSTPIHAYTDSVGVSTIGWGSTFYDSILNGKKKVKIGDKITKAKADEILENNIANLAKTYKQKMKHWTKMTEDQKAGLLSLGYNAPYGPIGAYPKLTRAIQSGDMNAAASNIDRGGPSQHRIDVERKLISSGPSDLTKVKAPKDKTTKLQQQSPTTKTKVKRPEDGGSNIFQQVGDWFKDRFGGKPETPKSNDKPPVKKQVGGAVNTTQTRFMDAQTAFAESVGERMSPHVVVVKRRPQMPMTTGDDGENTMSAGGVNIVELADKLHRIHSGANF